jgi:hypothetical protein
MPSQRSLLRWMLGLLGLSVLLGASLVAGSAADAVVGSGGTTPTTATPAGLTWSTLSPPASPPPLVHAAAAYDADNATVVVFGGVLPSGALSGDTWVWDGTTWLDYKAGTTPAPAPRQLASMAFDPEMHQLILFGGEGPGGELLDDTWAWNGLSWYEVTGPAFGSAPTPREGAAMAYSPGGDLVLFGGRGVPPAAPPVAPTAQVSTTTSTLPSAVSSATTPSATTPSATTEPPTAAQAETLGDTWLWTTTGWVRAKVSGPQARAGASMAYDSSRNVTVLFGGETAATGSSGNQVLGDTWIWDGSSWRRPGAATSASASTASTGVTTTTTPPAPSPSPPARFDASLVDDPSARGLVLFGGMSAQGVRSDAWSWGATPGAPPGWSPLSSSGGPPAEGGGVAAFDTATDQLVVFGGDTSAGAAAGSTVVLWSSAPVSLGTSSTAPTSSAVGVPSSASIPGPAAAAPASHSSGTIPGASARRSPVSASATVLRRGWLVTLTGSGFAPKSTILITFHSAPVLVGRTIATQAGTFSVVVSVPDNASPGTHHFVATGEGRNGRPTELTVAIRVVGGGLFGTASAIQKAVLIAAAVLFPLATWVLLDAAGWWRRRRHPRIGV